MTANTRFNVLYVLLLFFSVVLTAYITAWLMQTDDPTVPRLMHMPVTRKATTSMVQVGSPSITAKIDVEQKSKPERLAHIVKFYGDQPKKNDNELSFMECVSVLSIMINLKPTVIYYHTNYPDFWPFDSCNPFIKTWTEIEIKHRRRKFRIGGVRFANLWHEVDLTKQEIMSEYGGASFDMDVFVINGEKIYDTLKTYECMVCQEGGNMLNAGFVACNLNAQFPKRLIRAYKEDYQQGWWYNSAQLPMQIYRKEGFNKTVFIDDTISDNPPGWGKDAVLEEDGKVKWWTKVGYHSFKHDRGFTNETILQAPETSFKWMLRWILDKQYNATLLPSDNLYAHYNSTAAKL